MSWSARAVQMVYEFERKSLGIRDAVRRTAEKLRLTRVEVCEKIGLDTKYATNQTE